MLVSFIGSPASGKTTVAATVFARLKDAGLTAEFVVEAARRYIADLRIDKNLLGPNDVLQLTDLDQAWIMELQLTAESRFVRSCGPDVAIISDGCPLNSLLYLNAEARRDTLILSLVKKTLAQLDLVFYATPIPVSFGYDPNRVHSFSQSKDIDSSIPSIIAEFAPGLEVHSLFGSTSTRVSTVLELVFNRLTSGLPRDSAEPEFS